MSIYSMIEVVATVCMVGVPFDLHPNELLTAPDTKPYCKQIHRTFNEDPAKITPRACMLNSQKFVIEWLQTHPGWEPRKYGCRPYKGQNDI